MRLFVDNLTKPKDGSKKKWPTLVQLFDLSISEKDSFFKIRKCELHTETLKNNNEFWIEFPSMKFETKDGEKVVFNYFELDIDNKTKITKEVQGLYVRALRQAETIIRNAKKEIAEQKTEQNKRLLEENKDNQLAIDMMGGEEELSREVQPEEIHTGEVNPDWEFEL